MINCKQWVAQNVGQLDGKRVAIFGATGGIGGELCRYILQLGATLITIDRNPAKAATLRQKLATEFPNSAVIQLTADLENIDTVENVCRQLETDGVDIVIHNAGAYSIPRKACSTGFDNVFQINFVSPYYVTARLAEHLSARGGRVIAVGSIAHDYADTDPADIDFSTRKQAGLVYGNAKRYLMGALPALLQDYPNVVLAVTHPGITLTNITAHYPKWVFACIKYPMKWLFMPPKKAALNIVQGLFDQTDADEWIGPCLFHVWGEPSKQPLCSIPAKEREHIDRTAKEIYAELIAATE